MSRKTKYVVLGFTSVRCVTKKSTGEVYNAINVSIGEIDPAYTGRRCSDLFLRCSPGQYDWLREGVYVDPDYTTYGSTAYITGLYPVED